MTESKMVVYIDGKKQEVPQGVSVAAALLASGHGPQFRRTVRQARPRGMFCGMGICFDCLVTVDGRAEVRACMTAATDGMRIETR